MNKWYKSNWIKAILSFLVCLSLVTVAVCTVCLATSLGNNATWSDITKNNVKTYSKSQGFVQTLNNMEYEILNQIYGSSQFETNGSYDENKLVDIKEYVESGVISGVNTSGFAYTIHDLDNWYSTEPDIDYAYTDTYTFVVCKKPDGTYHYYTPDEFRSLVTDSEFHFNIQDGSDLSSEELLDDLLNGAYTYSYSSGIVILDTSNQLIYSDCWTLETSLPESYPPDGAESILDIANNNANWNGNLSGMYNDLDAAINSLSNDLNGYRYPNTDFSEGNSNLAYLLIDHTGKKVYSNYEKYTDYAKFNENINTLKALGAYVVITPDLKGFETNLDAAANDWRMHSVYLSDKSVSDDFTFVIAVNTAFPIQDEFYTANQDYNAMLPYYMPLMVMDVLGLLIFLIAIVWLTAIAGRTNRSSAVCLNQFDKIWTEAALALVLVLWLTPFALLINVWDSYQMSSIQMINVARLSMPLLVITGSIALITAACFLLGWLSLVRRIKAFTIWKNSLCRKLFRLIARLFRRLGMFLRDFWNNRRLTFKITVTYFGFCLIHWISCFAWSYSFSLFLMVLCFELAGFVYLIRRAIVRDKIKDGIRRISEGNVDYKIDTTHLKGNDFEVANLINNIGNGLSAAVSKSMKDERMKTDLITNVSHDIKTPLTSIINYVDLLKRENFTDPKVVGYIEILEQKAQRLKNLTEDVVEASKVSSGNISLEMMNINFVEMLNQIDGEYSEKFESRGLEVIVSMPDTPIIVYADGRRLSRILENIYGNAFKYAMEGTRIYADLTLTDSRVIFSLKNISAQSLNISADELTERFIRGDVARTTEGSGLGLSIAKSLTELQGGTFTLYLDGDLFKVTITFPIGKTS